ncbi:hypothetical protein IQ238_28615 [Pleurocapsales cyanobacterium LEGE 06147]|nr:hypothetical protein [Pleurocapsales cyanobacterium LEGE 06147]
MNSVERDWCGLWLLPLPVIYCDGDGGGVRDFSFHHISQSRETAHGSILNKSWD